MNLELVKSGWQIEIFQKSNFCLKPYILSLATNSCFPWSDRLIWLIFETMLAKDTIWITIVCQLFSQIKTAFYEKAASSAHNSQTSDFPWDNILFWCVTERLHVYFAFCHIEYEKYSYMLKKDILRAPDLIKLIFFTTWSRAFPLL